MPEAEPIQTDDPPSPAVVTPRNTLDVLPSSDAQGPWGGGTSVPDYPWRKPPPAINSVMGDYEGVTADAKNILGSKEAETERVNTEQVARLKRDADMERTALGAVAAGPDSLPHEWNADKERAERMRSPMEAFGSFGSVFAMIASGFSRQPMQAALNAGAAAMNAIHESDEAGYQKAYNAWKDNTQLAIKRFDMHQKVFDDTQHLFSTDLNLWKAENTAIAAKYDDKLMLNLLQHGMYPQAIEAMEKRAKAANSMREALEGQEIYNSQHSALDAFREEMNEQHGPNAPEGAVKWSKPQVEYALALKMAELKAKDDVTRIVASGMREYFAKNSKEMPAPEQAQLRAQAQSHLYGAQGRTLSGQVQVLAEQLQLPKDQGGENLPPGPSLLEARRRLAQATAGGRLDPALVNQLDTYPNLKIENLEGISLQNAQKLLVSTVISPGNLEEIAEFARTHPKAIGLVADAAKRMNLDAVQALFSRDPAQAKTAAESQVSSNIDETARRKKLEPSAAGDAKVLAKLLSTQAFADAALAGRAGGNVYLEKAFREIYQQASSPQAFFRILEERYKEADRFADAYKMGFDKRNDLDKHPFWNEKATGFVDRLGEKFRRPTGVPKGSGFDPDLKQWKTLDGRYFDESGKELEKHGSLDQGMINAVA